MNKPDSTKIFSKTINYYDSSRPSYPSELFDFLKDKFRINTSHIIADIGSGTGIFSKLLLDRGYHVISVEPNCDMRKIAEENLKHYPFYKNMAASAEATGLGDSSVDIITAATAFHWFNPKLAKDEFKRILKADGICILVWNIRNNNFPIMQNYELMMRNSVNDYDRAVGIHYSSDDVITEFFSPNKIYTVEFPNVQTLDFAGFKGRILSTSYSPREGEYGYEALLAAAGNLFNKYQTSGTINLYYSCKCYIGKL